ncbi:MAG: hypothetical protein AAFO80_02140 [Pseudomonadota bacterium]
MATVGEYFRRLAQLHFVRIVCLSIGTALIDWIFGLAAFLGLGSAYLLTRLWESGARLHNRIFAPVFLVLLAFGPVAWTFDFLVGRVGSQLIDPGETWPGLAMGGIVAMIGLSGAGTLFQARRKPVSERAE